MVEKEVRISYNRKLNEDLSSAFKVEGPLCHRHDIEELFQILGIAHIVINGGFLLIPSREA